MSSSSFLYKHTFIQTKVARQLSLVFLFRSSREISAQNILLLHELANSLEKVVDESNKNREVVLALYEALNTRDVDTVHKILATDLEWWFHGPPTHQFLMRLLTGASSDDSFRFEFDPLSLTTFGSIVVVEGCDHSSSTSWVHAWTVTDGIITQVREYLNTSLTVTLLGNTTQSPPSDYNPSPSSSTAEITSLHCPPVWESSFSNRVGKSVPGLVLAI
ncbi:Wound-induced protein 1 [Hibiscus syriacus]|uniref:Wound-induced protein 1 n=2 Tax=Hibiscus syriacus TaxID=106335 RepID=A0A6A3BJ70_HIBSY|nr:Wound-induced protein 1 [Hibiscus syriacus]